MATYLHYDAPTPIIQEERDRVLAIHTRVEDRIEELRKIQHDENEMRALCERLVRLEPILYKLQHELSWRLLGIAIVPTGKVRIT